MDSDIKDNVSDVNTAVGRGSSPSCRTKPYSINSSGDREFVGKHLRVALVHDWLTGMRGGERCLEVLCGTFPNSAVFTLFAQPDKVCESIRCRIAKKSFLNYIPGIEKFYRYLLPLYPLAALDLERKLAKAHKEEPFDLVLSVSHCAVKNIAAPEGVKHVCYCLTPVRYIWDQYEAYFANSKLEPLIRIFAHALRAWDRRGAKKVDQFISISRFVSERILRYYGRVSSIVYPPVDFSWLNPALPGEKGDGFICVSALVPYKKVDVVIDAFNKLPYQLTVIGSGPEEAKLRAMAGPNITFKKSLSDAKLALEYRRARGMIFVAEEDFGMVTVEMQASGRPVIAHGKGGSSEIVRWRGANSPMNWAEYSDSSYVDPEMGDFKDERSSGILLDQVTPSHITEAIKYLVDHEGDFGVENCKSAASDFSVKKFCEGLARILSGEESSEFARLAVNSGVAGWVDKRSGEL